MDSEVFIINLPKLQPHEYSVDNETARTLAERFRQLRLHALMQSPEAFASSYETEVVRDLDFTLRRLETPEADHFFAIDRDVQPWTLESQERFWQELFAAKWVGMIVNIGPLDASGSTAISAQRDPLARLDGKSERSDLPSAGKPEMFCFHLNGVFVDETCRGFGIGHALIDAAIEKGVSVSESAGAVTTLFSILVDSQNGAARRLYGTAGFDETSEETYLQQPRGQLGELQARERRALRMERCQTKIRESPAS